MKIDRCPKCEQEPMTYRSTPFIRLNPTTILGDTKYVCHCFPCGLIVKGKTRDEAIAKWNEMTKRGLKMESENETFDEVLRCIQNDIVHFVGKPAKHSRDLLQEYHDRFKAAHRREVAELKSKMNDVVCENEALRDACGTCGAKREREATREKSSQVGNAAKMREALEEISREIWESIDPFCNDDCCKPKRELAKIADAALSAPPRNCDRPECATTKAAQNVWRKEDGGKTAYYEWLLAASTKGGEK